MYIHGHRATNDRREGGARRLMHRTCDRCGARIDKNGTYYHLRKVGRSDNAIKNSVLLLGDTTYNANATEDEPEYCKACIDDVFEYLNQPKRREEETT